MFGYVGGGKWMSGATDGISWFCGSSASSVLQWTCNAKMCRPSVLTDMALLHE